MDIRHQSNEDERLRILRLVEEGSLTAEQAIRLLNDKSSTSASMKSETVEASELEYQQAASPETGEPVTPKSNGLGGNGRWLRVRVTDMATGRNKVIVNLPTTLVNWGMKVGARYAPEVADLDFDELSKLIESGAGGKLVEVFDEEDGEHVEVFID
jgi:hypothetical protein